MTLAIATGTNLIVAVLLLVIAGTLALIRPRGLDLGDGPRVKLPPRPTEPRSHVSEPVGRPVDWTRDDEDLA